MGLHDIMDNEELEKRELRRSKKYPGITVAQEIALDWIIDYFARKGKWPRIVRIKEAMGVSKAAAGAIVRKLRKAKYIRSAQSGRVIRGVTYRCRSTSVSVTYCKVFIGPAPIAGISPSEAIDLANKLYVAAKEAKRNLDMAKKRQEQVKEPEKILVDANAIRTLALALSEMSGRCKEELIDAASDAGIEKDELDQAMFSLGTSAGIDWRL